MAIKLLMELLNMFTYKYQKETADQYMFGILALKQYVDGKD